MCTSVETASKQTNNTYMSMIISQSLSYFKQYKFKSILLLLTNLYGPKDNFDQKSSHVIAALIKKFVEGKINNKKFVEVWGDGRSTRDFCYVDDIVDGLISTAKIYKKIFPLNLGSGKEISIKKIANLIKSEVGYKGKIRWLKNKTMDNASEIIGWLASLKSQMEQEEDEF